MARLPFVVEPRLKPIMEEIGSEESGKILVQRRGFLSAGEKAFFSNSLQSDNISELMLGLVRKIAKEYKIDIKEAYEVAADVISGVPRDDEIGDKIREKFPEDLHAVTTAAIESSQRNAFVKAYCLLLYRVESAITAEEAMDLHPDILEGLSKLYDEEEAKSIQRLAEANDSHVDADAIEDVEKK